MRMRFVLAALATILLQPFSFAEDAPAVSYYKDVRPILQQHCNGCHQPAKPMGGYITTTHGDLLKAGEREKHGVVPGKPADSYLLNLISIHDDGKAEMPRNRDPLTNNQIQLIEKWIEKGALDDTPASAKAVVVDAEHPPKYSAPPVVTSLQFSPDGSRLAVTGYHEILLYDTTKYELKSRLIGISERVQSLSYSPDGKRLAAVGGAPGRYGEVQIWNPDRERLLLSAPTTFDTLFGVSWSPDGNLLAFGCADNTVRAIDASSGKQVLQMGTHTDWVLGTVFAQDGVHLASVSRDMSMKLTHVATQRFIDNVTSITPGALKGGLMAMDRRPVTEKKLQVVPKDTPGAKPNLYDELIAAGADGTPRLYKMHREVKREIGDDSNRIREYEKMPGRISALAFNPDGTKFAAVSSLDSRGEVYIYDVKTGKAVACEKVSGPAYTVAWHPEGKLIASSGFDGVVWLHDAATGKLIESFTVLPR